MRSPRGQLDPVPSTLTLGTRLKGKMTTVQQKKRGMRGGMAEVMKAGKFGRIDLDRVGGEKC